VLAEVFVDAYGDLVRTVDFAGLTVIVQELAQAQMRTEQRLGELAQAQARTEQRLEELAQAQTRTEQRLEQLVQAQARTEQRMEELALAQARTEQRMDELTLAQKELALAQARTEQRMEELAQAQARTEGVLQRLTQEHRETRRQLGGIAMTIGYTLENAAFKALPDLLQRHFGLVIRGRLTRRYVSDNSGAPIEVNIFGEATQDGAELVIVGESKSQLSKNDIDSFVRRKVRRLEGVFRGLFPLLITHMTTAPEVESYAQQKGIALFYSYDL